jgi:hypothetical protein
MFLLFAVEMVQDVKQELFSNPLKRKMERLSCAYLALWALTAQGETVRVPHVLTTAIRLTGILNVIQKRVCTT